MRYKYISLTLLAALVAANKIDAQAIRSVPKLVVNITIDQFNTNFLEAFAPLYDMEAELDRLNNKLATRTDYESDEYMSLIEE